MPGQRRVPQEYDTPADAIADAAAGDVILLSPGTYGTITLDRPVHLVGDTEDVYGDPVQITAPKEGRALQITTTDHVICEGLWIRSGVGHPNGQAVLLVDGADVHLNRCAVETTNGSFGEYPEAFLAGGYVRLRLTNCTRQRRDADLDNGVYGVSNAASEVAFLACWWQKEPPITEPLPPDEIASWFDDTVRVATDGYGVEYGEWLRPQLLTGSYSIAGRETLESGDSLDEVQILLYRETAYQSGQLQRYAWQKTSPDPVTGEWSLPYLPTHDANGNPQRYAVAINPPECYGAELLRWYTPEQEE